MTPLPLPDAEARTAIDNTRARGARGAIRLLSEGRSGPGVADA